MSEISSYDVIVIGAGAAGLMCALTAGQRGRNVLVLDHANKVGKKILMSGGGRCNFTNLHTSHENFLSQNPHFCKSALSRYTQWDFIALVEKYGVPYYEKSLGQLFCKNKSRDILNLLLDECRVGKVTIRANTTVTNIQQSASGFQLKTTMGMLCAESLVIATGGLSIPRMGATGFGYDIARQFGLNILETRAALVPFTLSSKQLTRFSTVVGGALDVTATAGSQSFREAMLFTHKGISGPAILQISSYWRPGESVLINALPSIDVRRSIMKLRADGSKTQVKTWLARLTSKAFANVMTGRLPLAHAMADLSNNMIDDIAEGLSELSLKPSGTEGYSTAEVTLGGVDTKELSSKTMMSNSVENLFFIGEVVDVTGHLGGFNFQWAWSSGYAAGCYT